MLLLMRRAGASIQMTGGITLTVLRVSKDSVRLGIEAPVNIRVQRTETLPGRPLGSAKTVIKSRGNTLEGCPSRDSGLADSAR